MKINTCLTVPTLIVLVSIATFASTNEVICSNPEGTIRGNGSNWMFKDKLYPSSLEKGPEALNLDGSIPGLDKEWNLGKTGIWGYPAYYMTKVKLVDPKTHKLIVADYVFCHSYDLPAH